jgi:rhodanese-related sulfurtransferase
VGEQRDRKSQFENRKSIDMKHSPEFEAIVDDAKSRIREVTVEETQRRMNEGANLIDVREDNEWESSHASGATHMGRGVIERDIVQAFPQKDTELILYCGGGFRSALAADMLQKMGYTNVFSMAGGWKAWKESGAATE